MHKAQWWDETGLGQYVERRALIVIYVDGTGPLGGEAEYHCHHAVLTAGTTHHTSVAVDQHNVLQSGEAPGLASG